MKKRIAVIGVALTCLLSLTACSGDVQYNTVAGTKYDESMYNEASLLNFAQSIEDSEFEGLYAQGVTPDNFEAQMFNQITDDDTYKVVKSGYESWYKAINDLGYNSPETLANDISVSGIRYYVNSDEELVIESTLQGTLRTADMMITLTPRGKIKEVGVTVLRSFGEKMLDAVYNTIIGMGMAFVILILISLIISLFPIVLGGKKKDKKAVETVSTAQAMDNTISQIEEQEEASNDAELVAAIAAAIAAYEGTSADGFRVRSIRKVGKSSWKRV